MWHRHLACGVGRACRLPNIHQKEIRHQTGPRCSKRRDACFTKMKSPLEAPEKQIAEETSAKPATPSAVIDTSRMAKGKREALELTEASRDPLDDRGSFASNLFIGRNDFARIHPYPAQNTEDRAAAKEFLARLKKYLRENIDAHEIDRTGEIPQKNIDDLFAMGAFGVKIPKQYGGLGLSQVNYRRAPIFLGTGDAHLPALISAHLSSCL